MGGEREGGMWIFWGNRKLEEGVIVKCKGSHVSATSGGCIFFHLNAEPESQILNSLSLYLRPPLARCYAVTIVKD